MAVKEIITEELLKDMMEGVSKGYYINSASEDLYIVLATPHSYYYKNKDKCFRIRVKKAWFSVSVSSLQHMSLESLNKALSIELLEYQDDLFQRNMPF